MDQFSAENGLHSLKSCNTIALGPSVPHISVIILRLFPSTCHRPQVVSTPRLTNTLLPSPPISRVLDTLTLTTRPDVQQQKSAQSLSSHFQQSRQRSKYLADPYFSTQAQGCSSAIPQHVFLNRSFLFKTHRCLVIGLLHIHQHQRLKRQKVPHEKGRPRNDNLHRRRAHVRAAPVLNHPQILRRGLPGIRTRIRRISPENNGIHRTFPFRGSPR